MALRQMTRAQLAVLWLHVLLVSPDTRIRTSADVLDYPELPAVQVKVN